MCTVSWLYSTGGYHLFFNRDERLTRRPALAPAIRQTEGMNYLSPLDGDHGGTWIGVNESGLTLCLLNRYDEFGEVHAGEFHSRGEIIPGLIAAVSMDEVDRLIKALRLIDYPPFTLAAFSLIGESWQAHWSGDTLEVNRDQECRGMITSSSFATSDVIAGREDAYRQQIDERLDVDANTLRRFHASHDPISGARSVCLHRKDAVTVSLTRIFVTREQARCWYYPSSPCAISAGVLTETSLPVRH
jgi:uncharacterized protein with NRDE domain